MKTKYFIGLILLCVFCVACGDKPTENILVVSIEPQRALLEEIVGERYEVVTMLTPGSNPETFEPGMQARRSLENAAAYFVTGTLPFEQKLTSSSPASLVIADCSFGIERVYGTHSHNHDGHEHHHDEGGADPHLWTSVRNARKMAENMYNTLITIDPEGKEYYTERYNALDHRLDSLDNAFAQRLAAPGINKAFAIWHPSLSYLARDYGLEQLAVGFENKEMPVGALKRIIDEAKEDSVKVFFFQKEFDSRQANTLNKEMGTRMVTINPLDYEWEAQLDTIVSSLCR